MRNLFHHGRKIEAPEPEWYGLFCTNEEAERVEQSVALMKARGLRISHTILSSDPEAELYPKEWDESREKWFDVGSNRFIMEWSSVIVLTRAARETKLGKEIVSDESEEWFNGFKNRTQVVDCPDGILDIVTSKQTA